MTSRYLRFLWAYTPKPLTFGRWARLCSSISFTIG